jgi:hypothetical protein
VAADLRNCIDREHKRITSSTGELVWDYGKGLLTVNSLRSQGATGFLARAGLIKLGSVTIDSRNEYGAIHVISLDGEPITASRRILIQAFTEEKMDGFKSANGVIQDIGHTPITVRDIDTRVTIANGAGFKAVSLDEQGYPRGNPQVQMAEGSATVTLSRDGLYTILMR